MRRLGTILLLMLFAAAGPMFGYERLSVGSSYETDGSSQFRDESVRWGGDGIVLTVGKNSASMQFGCARAHIPGGLKPVRGKFKVSGTYTPSTAIVSAETPRSTAIRAEGRITGKRMTLKLTSLETGKVIGSYTLERGKAVALSRCL